MTLRVKIVERRAIELLNMACDRLPDIAGYTLIGVIEREYQRARQQNPAWAEGSVLERAIDAMDDAALQWRPDGVMPAGDALEVVQAAKNDGFDLFRLALSPLRERAVAIEKRRSLYESSSGVFEGLRRQLIELANAFEAQARARLTPQQQDRAVELAALMRGKDWDRVISTNLRDTVLASSPRADIVFDPAHWPGVDAMAIEGAITDCHLAYSDLCRVYDSLTDVKKQELSPAGRPTP
jgi:hypothetical protein